MGGSKFLVCMRNANQATKLMVAEGFRLNHEKVAVEAVGPPVTYVNVYRLPAYLPDDVLTNALQQYGKVKSVTFATVATRQNKLNGVRVVKMEMSKPVPNFTTIQGHRVMCKYRGMRRVCARCGDDGHMASACTRPYCKRCGVFGHDTEGCILCSGSKRLPVRERPTPNSDQSSEPALSKASASTSGLQALKPKSPLPTKKKTPNYWDGDKTEENDARSAATSSLTHQGDQRDGSEDTASVTSDSDHLAICTSESSSEEPSPNSSPSPTSSGEEQAFPTFAASLEAATTESPHANSESLAQPPLGSSRVASLEDAPIVSCGRYVLPPEHAYVIPASDPGPSRQALVDSRTEAAPSTAGASQPGLSQWHCSRSRRRQGDRGGSEQKERAGSTENNLRRSKTAVVSSDSDAARRAESENPTRPKRTPTGCRSASFVKTYAAQARRSSPTYAVKPQWRDCTVPSGTCHQTQPQDQTASRQFGFPTDFVALVRILYSDLTGNVVVNGSITAGFYYTRGIRQGWPLGPTFFIISLEPESLGEIQKVSMVKVLGIYFKCDGVAEATWQRALERAHLVATRIEHLDLTLREKALAVKTSVCAFANYVCRVAVMPSKTASQLNSIINTLLWDGKPALVKRNLLQLPESEGGLALPHVVTIGRILALKTVRLLYQASDFFGKGLLLYWCSTNTRHLDADRHTGPVAEFPSPFYKMTANTKRMLDKDDSSCDIDRDPPAETNAQPALAGGMRENSILEAVKSEAESRPPKGEPLLTEHLLLNLGTSSVYLFRFLRAPSALSLEWFLRPVLEPA
ncbi:hypothetical protein HPB50_018589 [Hyalomma asiaticum]|uniref:Uncharacterized protein n=1 Tax=Hyalomma asiaticum TaxID=266040 RepID=A0ACB7SMF7_HYAAI|nr:hypothetical protein HPB50_018589 [Hyalomma asiaticum]